MSFVKIIYGDGRVAYGQGDDSDGDFHVKKILQERQKRIKKAEMQSDVQANEFAEDITSDEIDPIDALRSRFSGGSSLRAHKLSATLNKR